MDETLLTIFLAILGQYALLITVLVQNGTAKEAINSLKNWKKETDARLTTLEHEHIANHRRPASHD